MGDNFIHREENVAFVVKFVGGLDDTPGRMWCYANVNGVVVPGEFNLPPDSYVSVLERNML